MPLKVLLGLIFCNFIWSAHPAMAKLVMADVPPSVVAWLRYTSALGAYLLVYPSIRGRGMGPMFFKPRSWRDGLLALGIGFMAFCFAPLMQMTGLESSRATDNALIVAMEPLMTVLLARIFVGERLSKAHFLAFALALTGFSLLSGFHPWAFFSVSDSLGGGNLFGNLLLLTALIGEASYSVFSLKLLDRYPPMGVFGLALGLGVGVLTLAVSIFGGAEIFLSLSHLSWRGLLGLFWLGPMGTAFAYFYWMSVLREVSVASIALTLFIQPVLGAIWGYLFLHETLTPVQGAGACLILLGVMTQGAISRYQATLFPSALSD